MSVGVGCLYVLLQFEFEREYFVTLGAPVFHLVLSWVLNTHVSVECCVEEIFVTNVAQLLLHPLVSVKVLQHGSFSSECLVTNIALPGRRMIFMAESAMSL